VSDAAAAVAGAVPTAHDDHHWTSTGLNNRKVVFWTFIGSECMFFGSLIATYLIYKGKSVGGPTPHQILNIPLTSFSAFDLLMSSLTMVLALAGIQRGNMTQARIWLLATALLGSVFIGGQIFEFTEFARKGLSLDSNLFSSTFFVLTGFHGAHVTIGIIWLISLWGLATQGRLRQGDAEKVEVAGLYWHFVDVVWIVIFTVVYLIPQPR